MTEAHANARLEALCYAVFAIAILDLLAGSCHSHEARLTAVLQKQGGQAGLAHLGEGQRHR